MASDPTTGSRSCTASTSTSSAAATPSIYGDLTLPELERQDRASGQGAGAGGALLPDQPRGRVRRASAPPPDSADAAIINAGAWTHYSWAIRDALEFSGMPAVEVHISDVSQREEWRSVSVFDGLVIAAIYGKKAEGYREALSSSPSTCRRHERRAGGRTASSELVGRAGAGRRCWSPT